MKKRISPLFTALVLVITASITTVSAGRKSPFRAGRKSPILAG